MTNVPRDNGQLSDEGNRRDTEVRIANQYALPLQVCPDLSIATGSRFVKWN